jgi:signal transduction histidine kinase
MQVRLSSCTLQGTNARILVSNDKWKGLHVPLSTLTIGHVTQHTTTGTDRSWLKPGLAWAAVIAVAIALGSYAKAPVFPGMGRTLPRVPAPPQDLSTLLYMLGVGSIVWYAVVVSLPLLVWLARRTDTDRYSRARIIVAAFAIFATLVAITIAVEYFITYGDSTHGPPFNAYLPIGLKQDLMPWIACAAIIAAIETRRRSVQARVERERLRAQIAEQRLIALTGQLHPHFLFNTLQGISTLIHRDADAADEMLSRLSDLLRDLLRHRDSALVTLGEEIRYIRTYLEISQVRFADRLRFSIDVDPGLEGAAVPLFILQPLVENALNHGIGGRAQGGSIAVRAKRSGTRLHLEVADDGVGIAIPNDGMGLSNTRERLRASFDDDQRLSIEPGDDGGTLARIDIPFHPVTR